MGGNCAKFILKPGESIRLGRGRGNEAGSMPKKIEVPTRRVSMVTKRCWILDDFDVHWFWVKAQTPDKLGSAVLLRTKHRQVLLDYEGVSKAHAEVSLREKLPEEVILGSDVKLPTMLSIRDLTSRNGIGIHKKHVEADQDIPTIGSFERLQSATSQAQCSNLVAGA